MGAVYGRIIEAGAALAAAVVVACPAAATASGRFEDASDDATTVVFSTAEPLTIDETDLFTDLYTRSGDTTTRVSVPAPGGDASGSVGLDVRSSADGSRIFFNTTAGLVAADTDGEDDIYERSGGTTKLVSAPGTGGVNEGGRAFLGDVTADGTRVFFRSTDRLVGADTDDDSDVYERSGGTTTLVSVPGTGAAGPSAGANFQRASVDGSRVFFQTVERLVTADTDDDVDVYQRSGGVTTLVSVPAAGAGGPSEGIFFNRASADGSRVFLHTKQAMVISDGDGLFDVYERSGGNTVLVSAPGAGAAGSPAEPLLDGASADGTKLFFSTAERMVGADTDDLRDVYERSGGATTLVSAAGAGAVGPAAGAEFSGSSADGTKAFFVTGERLVAADTDTQGDIYERSGGVTSLVSEPGVGAAGASEGAAFRHVTSDGAHVFFETKERLVTGDTDPDTDVYEHVNGVTRLVSARGAGAGPSVDVHFAGASSDGDRVLLDTGERMTSEDVDTSRDVYERFVPAVPHSLPVTRLVSVEPGPPNGAPPDTKIDTGPTGFTVDSTPTFTFSALEQGVTFECRLDSQAFAPCVSPKDLGTLAEGLHTFQVRATDEVGNVEPVPAERTFTIDTLTPQTTFSAGPQGPTRVTAPEFVFGAGEPGVTFECSFDNATFAPCTSSVQLGPQPDGPHTFRVRATDAAGHVEDPPAERQFTVDTVVPETTIVGAPPAFTANASPTFEFVSSEPGSTFACRIDGVRFDCGSPVTVGPLANGEHVFNVAAVDAAGNEDPTASFYSFRVEAAAPPGGTAPPAAGPADARDTSVVLSATAAKTQSVRKAVLTVAAGCVGESCDLVAAGTVDVPGAGSARRLKLTSARGRADAGQRATLRLRIPKRALSAIQAGLRKAKSAKRVVATVKLTATDAAGNRSSTTVKFRLKR